MTAYVYGKSKEGNCSEKQEETGKHYNPYLLDVMYLELR